MDLIVTRSRIRLLSAALVASFVLTACGGEEGEETAAAAPTTTPPPASTSPPPSTPPPAGGSNQAPTISGTPAGSTLFGRQYSFTPAASDANGDVLTFSVTGRPSWAAFDSSTGRLQGTPTQGDVGTNANIVISVSDGAATRSLASFNIQVVATATGSATLSWVPPTQNSDGSPLIQSRVLPCLLRHELRYLSQLDDGEQPGSSHVRRGSAHAGDVVLRRDRRERKRRGERPVEHRHKNRALRAWPAPSRRREKRGTWWAMLGLNQRPLPCESSALPLS